MKFRREDTEDLPVLGFEESTSPGRAIRSLICLRNGEEVGVASGLTPRDLERVARAFCALPHQQAPGEGGRRRLYLLGPPFPVAEVAFYNDPHMTIRFPRFIRFREEAPT